MKDFLLTRLLAAALLLAFISLPNSANANVSVSDIKVNGSSTQVPVGLDSAAQISYILTDDATLGATINIISNGASIRAISIPTAALNSPGTGLSRGANTVTWDGRDANANFVPAGNYYISVTARSSGHAAWTLLTTNAVNTNILSGGYYVFAPRGIAVDTDTNSACYGRVFVANSATGPSATNAGDQDAILKFNADGSAADDGAYGAGGYPMQDDNFALPQKLRTAADDRLYMNDYYNGEIVAFDPALSTNQVALSPLNYFVNPFFQNPDDYNGYGWFAFDVTATSTTNGSSGELWLGDYGAGGSGIWSWFMVNGAAASTNSVGTWDIYAGAGGSLSIDATGGFMTATNNQIFASQYIDASGAPGNRCMMFTNVTGSPGPNSGPATNAAWAVGSGDNTFRDIVDTTIDSRQSPNFVACAMAGPSVSGLRLLNAANGSTAVANLDSTNTYYATAWDGVGNLYAASGSLHAWRVWSPPGSGNTATLLSQAVIQVGVQNTPVVIQSVAFSGSSAVITFSAAPSATPSDFSLLSSASVNTGYTTNTAAAFAQGASAGLFTATVPTNSSTQFYLIKQ